MTSPLDAWDEVERKPPRKAHRGELAGPYVLAVIVGALVVRLGWWAPALVMALYMGQGLGRARRTGVLLEFTDSFYYLGFTLTIISLLLSARIFGDDGAVSSPEVILRHYGVGLVTTVVGVIGRNASQLFYLSSDETAEAAAKEIARRTEEFLTSLEALNARMTALVKDTFTTLEHRVRQTVGDIEQELQDLSARLSSFSAALKTANIDPSGITEAFGQVRLSAEGATSAFARAAEHLRSVDEKLGHAVSSLEAVLRDFETLRTASASTGAVLQDLGSRVPRAEFTELRDAAAQARGQLIAFNEAAGQAAWQDLARTVKSLGAALRNTQAQVDRLGLSALASAASRGAEALTALRGALDSAHARELVNNIEGASQAAANFTRAVSGIVAAMNGMASSEPDGIVGLRAAMQNTAKHVEAANEALREIAEAVRTQINAW